MGHTPGLPGTPKRRLKTRGRHPQGAEGAEKMLSSGALMPGGGQSLRRLQLRVKVKVKIWTLVLEQFVGPVVLTRDSQLVLEGL